MWFHFSFETISKGVPYKLKKNHIKKKSIVAFLLSCLWFHFSFESIFLVLSLHVNCDVWGFIFYLKNYVWLHLAKWLYSRSKNFHTHFCLLSAMFVVSLFIWKNIWSSSGKIIRFLDSKTIWNHICMLIVMFVVSLFIWKNIYGFICQNYWIPRFLEFHPMFTVNAMFVVSLSIQK